MIYNNYTNYNNFVYDSFIIKYSNINVIYIISNIK